LEFKRESSSRPQVKFDTIMFLKNKDTYLKLRTIIYTIL